MESRRLGAKQRNFSDLYIYSLALSSTLPKKSPAVGKLWGIQPGKVVSKLREGGEHITKHGGKLKIESDNAW